MAGDGDYVLGAKDGGLVEDFAADFGEGEAVGGGVEVFQAAGVLDGLERYASYAGLLESEVDGLADLMIVETLSLMSRLNWWRCYSG